ncbi:hypothetical protein [Moorena sp. SIO4G3]|uniref:hypothetical protein n=1 Tax=Moorena sp. SIO4G3 TaxID=2607821 RepID=UPI0025D61866|nr:hypothetical protein [Moorena sp. SIO4G3]
MVFAGSGAYGTSRSVGKARIAVQKKSLPNWEGFTLGKMPTNQKISLRCPAMTVNFHGADASIQFKML